MFDRGTFCRANFYTRHGSNFAVRSGDRQQDVTYPKSLGSDSSIEIEFMTVSDS
jgi:hypothetical protein